MNRKLLIVAVCLLAVVATSAPRAEAYDCSCSGVKVLSNCHGGGSTVRSLGRPVRIRSGCVATTRTVTVPLAVAVQPEQQFVKTYTIVEEPPARVELRGVPADPAPFRAQIREAPPCEQQEQILAVPQESVILGVPAMLVAAPRETFLDRMRAKRLARLEAKASSAKVLSLSTCQ